MTAVCYLLFICVSTTCFVVWGTGTLLSHSSFLPQAPVAATGQKTPDPMCLPLPHHFLIYIPSFNFLSWRLRFLRRCLPFFGARKFSPHVWMSFSDRDWGTALVAATGAAPCSTFQDGFLIASRWLLISILKYVTRCLDAPVEKLRVMFTTLWEGLGVYVCITHRYALIWTQLTMSKWLVHIIM